MAADLDETVIRHVARLARLTITEEEVQVYARQLSQVMEYMNLLNEVDTSEVSPTAHAVQVSNVFRNDEVGTSLSAEQALCNASEREGGFFSVKKVIDH